MIFGILVFAYLLGAIPFGVIAARMRGIDITKVGSGNIGATNVKRALGPKVAYSVFALDVLKGALPAALSRVVLHDAVWQFDSQTFAFLVGVAAVLGHCFSPFLGFKGGKGVSTTLGAVAGAAPIVAAIGFVEFIVVVSIFRYVSLASLVCVWTTLASVLVVPGQSRQLLPLFVVVSLFITWKHRANIMRLCAGTEPKFSFGKSEPADSTSNQSTASKEADESPDSSIGH